MNASPSTAETSDHLGEEEEPRSFTWQRRSLRRKIRAEGPASDAGDFDHASPAEQEAKCAAASAKVSENEPLDDGCSEATDTDMPELIELDVNSPMTHDACFEEPDARAMSAKLIVDLLQDAAKKPQTVIVEDLEDDFFKQRQADLIKSIC